MSAEIANAIRASLPGAELRTRFNVPTATNTLVFEMHEGIDFNALYAMLETLRLGPKQFHVWASVVTESDNGGIELPDYILELIRRTHYGVGLSFVDVGPEDEEDDVPPPSQPVQ